jgi:hypothetical protein
MRWADCAPWASLLVHAIRAMEQDSEQYSGSAPNLDISVRKKLIELAI